MLLGSCVCVCACAAAGVRVQILQMKLLTFFSSCTKNFSKLIVRIVVVFFTVPSIVNECAVCLPRCCLRRRRRR